MLESPNKPGRFRPTRELAMNGADGSSKCVVSPVIWRCLLVLCFILIVATGFVSMVEPGVRPGFLVGGYIFVALFMLNIRMGDIGVAFRVVRYSERPIEFCFGAAMNLALAILFLVLAFRY